MNRLNVCDLNAIETRVGAWLSNCTGLLNVFQPRPGKPNGLDPYLDFATKMYGTPYDILDHDLHDDEHPLVKADAKLKRQVAKPGVLGAIYRLSGGGWGHSKRGHIEHIEGCLEKKGCDCPKVYDRVKTGLWGYADNMGVEMSQEQAHMVVRIFRQAYPEIPAFWKLLEDKTAEVLKAPNTFRFVGPNNCVKIDKLNIKDRGAIMRMQLPSGRFLHYIDARLENCKMPWDDREGNEVYREAMVYAGLNQDTKQWDIWIQTHGGKLFENLVQGIARDVLAVKLLEFEANDIPVVGHVHDEGICIVPDDPFSYGVDKMIEIMSTEVSWAPGLLLGADGFEDLFYHK